MKELLTTAEKPAEEGSLRFVILIDRIDEAFRDLMGYINETSRFDVFGAELLCLRFDGYENVIPKLHGAEVRNEVEAVGSSTRTVWDESRYFEDASHFLGAEEVVALRRLCDFSVGHADRATWSTVKTVGSFNPEYDHANPPNPCSRPTPTAAAISTSPASPSEPSPYPKRCSASPIASIACTAGALPPTMLPATSVYLRASVHSRYTS